MPALIRSGDADASRYAGALMARDIDERKKRSALRKLRRAAARAAEGKGPPLSDWEQRFLDEVDQRIEIYGSAFHDYAKGSSEEALSDLQRVKLKEIDAKTRGKVRKTLAARKPMRPARPA
jgi:hypothetical protein